METRLFDLFYYIGLPLIVSWAFWKFIGKSIVYIGVLSVLAGFFMMIAGGLQYIIYNSCLLYTSPSPRDRQKSRMPSSA